MLVEIESPFRGATQREQYENMVYARECLKDSLDRGEFPICSHLLYTQVLNDNDKEERKLGMDAGKHWSYHADLIAVYLDRGTSEGMEWGIRIATCRKIPITYRRIHV